MKTGIPTNGSMVKNHISLRTEFGLFAIRRTSFRSWFQACHRVLPLVVILQPQRHFQDRRAIVAHLPQAHPLHHLHTTSSGSGTPEREDPSGIDSHPVPVSSPNVEEMIERGDPLSTQRSKIPSGCKNSKRILWIQEFLNTETHTRVLLMNHLQNL